MTQQPQAGILTMTGTDVPAPTANGAEALPTIKHSHQMQGHMMRGRSN
jgi:hypothetical protein